MFHRLSIQSKFLVILLAVSLSAVIAVTYTSYLTARSAATEAAHRQLASVRVTKAALLRVMLNNYRDQLTSFTASRTALESLKTFSEAFDELDKSPASLEETKSLEDFYKTKFLPQLQQKTLAQPMLNMVMPPDHAGRKLQAAYIAANPHPYQAGHQLESAPNDSSSYTQAHSRFHNVFGQIARRVGIEDILLVEGAGLRVVYSYRKATDFGTNLVNGPYANSNLSEAVRAILKSADRAAFRVADFEVHRPSLGRPAAFICAPVFEGSTPYGAIVFQLPMDEVIRVMTGNFQWEREGFGKTGEVYLVGTDYLMRNRSRFMKEDPKAAVASFRRAGIPEKIIETIERQNNVLLALPVRTPSVTAALQGQEGVMETNDYRQEPVVSSYAPFDFDNIRWAVIAEMDQSEAYGPVNEMAKRAIATAAGISLLVSLAAFWLASLISRPLKTLTSAAHRLSAGERNVKAEIPRGDEIGELGEAFNQMASALYEKQETLEKTLRDNEELLLNILPAQAADRLREGEAQPLQTFADISVMVAEVLGIEQAPGGDNEALAWLHYIVIAFDEAAERHGVEKLKTMGGTYIAACGLSAPRPDHPQRMLEFAEELVRIVRLFNAERSANLEVDIGINAGPVTGGVIGRKKFIYDLWGETVNLARYLKADGVSSIQVTQSVYERLQHQYGFTRQDDILTKRGVAVPAYRLHSASASSGTASAATAGSA